MLNYQMPRFSHFFDSNVQVRETILPHVATLGYGPKFVQILERVTPHDPHGVLASCCVRMLYQFSDSKSIVKSIAAQSETTRPIKVLKSSMVPLHKDAAFTIETVRKMLEQNSVKGVPPSSEGGAADMGGPMSIGGSDEHVSALVREALDKDVNLISFLTSLLEGTVEGGDQVGSEVSWWRRGGERMGKGKGAWGEKFFVVVAFSYTGFLVVVGRCFLCSSGHEHLQSAHG